MNQKVIIIGASGHGKVILDIIKSCQDECIGFLDDDFSKKEFMYLPVLGTIDDYQNYPDSSFIIGIGNATIREAISQKLSQVKWYTAIHPTAIISSLDTEIGEGTTIMANTVINPGAKIGKHCIVNTSSVVEHDTILSDFSHLSVGAQTAGNVLIGKRTWIGIGATISNNITICDDVMVGAGAVVVDHISESGTYVGVPAKLIKPYSAS